MSNWIIAQVIACSLLFAVCLLLMWWYRRSVAYPARVEAAQYRFFALRDKAIRLAIKDTALREAPGWKAIYELVNEAAKQKNTDFLMRTSIPKLIQMSKEKGIPIPIRVGKGDEKPEDVENAIPINASNIDDLPPILSLFFGAVIAVLETCYSMTWWLRFKYKVAARIGKLRAYLSKRTGEYAQWQRLLSAIARPAAQMKLAADDFDDVITREASLQSNDAHCCAA